MTEGHRTTQASPGLQRPIQRRRTNLRRRYKLVTSGLMAVLLAVLGVGFAADAGTTTVSVATPDGVIVYPVGGDVDDGFTATPVDDLVTLPYSSKNAVDDELADPVTYTANYTSVDVPSWDVAKGSPGTLSATEAGDIAYIDAADTTGTKLMVSVYVTNLAALSVNYSAWAFNVGLYQSDAADGTWPTLISAASPDNDATDLRQAEVLTSDSGQVSFIVDATNEPHVSLSLDEGGSFFTADTDTSGGGALEPTFFIRVQQL